MSESPLPQGSQGLTITILGCGKMGTAIIRGLLSSLPNPSRSSSSAATSPPQPPTSIPLFTTFIACTHTPSSTSRLEATLPPHPSLTIIQNNNLHGIHQAAVVILAIKPASLSLILASPSIRAALREKLVISLLAGVSAERIKSLLQSEPTKTTTQASSAPTKLKVQETASARVIVAIPNLAASIQASMTVIVQPDPPLSKRDDASVTWIFGRLGHLKYVAAEYMNSAMVLSSASVAFAALFVQALAEGGEAVGLERVEGVELAVRAMGGMARLVVAGEEPAGVRGRVATPGGVTMEGVKVLEEGGLVEMVVEAVKRAKEKADRVRG